MMRASTDADPVATVLKVDGIGAYDHVFRAPMLGSLVNMEEARVILPFVRKTYANPSSCQSFTDDGECRTVTQAGGGEQGDPLMPLVFSLGKQRALEEVAASLLPGEQSGAFLDDVYLVCQPDRVLFLYSLFADALIRTAGIQLHQAKTRVWNTSLTVPDGVEELGPDVWQKDGITVLGTPIGPMEFVRQKMSRRIAEERRLWDTIPAVPDLHCAWQFLLQSANPRANHTLRLEMQNERPQVASRAIPLAVVEFEPRSQSRWIGRCC